MPKGLILRGIGGFYTVESDTGLYECKLRGIFRKQGITPLPGDFVEFSVTNEALREGWVESINDRQNAFVRPPVANVNRIAVVITAVSPAPDYLLVDKLLITARKNDIDPILIINKVDLTDDQTLSEIKEIYRGTGYPILTMSKITMEGYDALHELLCNGRTVFAGQSGVGKSTILNNVISSWVMETGDVSSKIQRGKHTTRHVQLLQLDCKGYVVDTPGFSSYSIDGIAHDELEWMYPEFEEHIGNCRYHGCSHLYEPDCAVKNAVDEGEIPVKRYECYRKLYEELKEAYERRYK